MKLIRNIVFFLVVLNVVSALIYVLRNPDVLRWKSIKPSTSQSNWKDIPKSIFYHEDSYKQVQLVPFENFSELIKEASNVKDFGEKHSIKGGGYSDLYIREGNSFKLKAKGIKSIELDTVFTKLPIERFEVVTTGIRPGEMKSENTLGYGEDYHGIFFDTESDIVTGIWIDGSPHIEKDEFSRVLNEIGSKWNLLLMDWNSLELIDLKNKGQIEKYLN